MNQPTNDNILFDVAIKAVSIRGARIDCKEEAAKLECMIGDYALLIDKKMNLIIPRELFELLFQVKNIEWTQKPLSLKKTIK